jgi:hypothetical protein
MNIFANILNAATGGLAEQIIGVVKTYFPPDMPPEKKAELQVELERIQLQREKQTNDATAAAEAALNERIREYEGTASDLKTIPYLGATMLFLRGAQRPIIGYGTIYLDFMVFSGGWTVTPGSQQDAAFWVINLLVFGFLFGERAVKNVTPMITQMMSAKK